MTFGRFFPSTVENMARGGAMVLDYSVELAIAAMLISR